MSQTAGVQAAGSQTAFPLNKELSGRLNWQISNSAGCSIVSLSILFQVAALLGPFVVGEYGAHYRRLVICSKLKLISAFFVLTPNDLITKLNLL